MKLYPAGQVVCVRLHCARGVARRYLGVILPDTPSQKHDSNSRVVSVHLDEDVPWIKDGVTSSIIGWFGEGPHIHDPIRLLIARTSARSFLSAFASGQVLKKRRQYRVAVSDICLADPKVLFRRIFENA